MPRVCSTRYTNQQKQLLCKLRLLSNFDNFIRTEMGTILEIRTTAVHILVIVHKTGANKPAVHHTKTSAKRSTNLP